jgi:hypothetical protein
VDSLFRVDPAATQVPANDATAAGPRNEIGRILDNGMRAGSLPAEDARYIAQLVAQRTGMSQQDAEARVDAAYQGAQKKLQEAEASARQAADQARKAGAYTALWIFVSLLLGAFVASLMATWGGRRRDLY